MLFSCDTENSVEPRYGNVFVKYHGSFGNQSAGQLAATSDGGFVMVGTTNFQDSDTATVANQMILIKVDENGNEQWQSYFGRGIDDVGKAVEVLPDGNGYLIAGNSTNINNRTDILLVQVGVDGSETRRLILGSSDQDEEVNDILLLNAGDKDGGSYMVIGSTTNVSAFDGNSKGVNDTHDYYYPKVTQDLFQVDSTEWKGYWGAEGFDKAVSAFQYSDNSYFICGTSDRPLTQLDVSDNGLPFANTNFYVRSVNEDDAEDTGGRRFGNEYIQIASEMSPTREGGQFIVGTSEEDNSSFIFASRIGRDGNKKASFTIRIDQTRGSAIVEAIGGGALVLGTIERNNNTDIILLRVNNNGVVLWQKIYGDIEEDDSAGDLIQLEDGSIVFTATMSLGRQQKIGLFKTDKEGNLLK